ncbi:Unannotated [Lentimonas sp. CC4]|nr:Unannotated [Lentimonas sp. CC4]CAA6687308.1 Unannotated [Lentimonas sp. CC6]CAA7077203.1 Unannotated [Lentimonas sp. CC4]CAA7171778.1 Unannotated [Lentimonas sp. CC21]CAA7183423.1 Unannotated [Lentimonas sp. CC8]
MNPDPLQSKVNTHNERLINNTLTRKEPHTLPTSRVNHPSADDPSPSSDNKPPVINSGTTPAKP